MTVKQTKTGRSVDPSFDLALQILNSCSEAKGKDLTLLDVSGIFDLASFFVIVSARSDRQVQGISNRIQATLEEEAHLSPISRDGYEEGHWVLMDYGDVIVHIFYEPLRDHYNLEGLWKDATRVELPESLTDQQHRSKHAA